MFPKPLQKIISEYQILGFIPLDKFLHFVVGLFITVLMRRMKIRFRWVFTVLIILEIIKEYIDSFAYTSNLTEHLLDAGATLIYPLIILVVRSARNYLEKKIRI